MVTAMKRHPLALLSSLLLLVGLTACGPGVDPDALRSSGLAKYPMAMIKGDAPKAGSPLIIEFWASWCGPCRAQVPHLNNLYPQLEDIGIQFVALTNEPVPFTREFVSTQDMRYPIACDPDSVYMSAAGIQFIPQAIILNAEGRIVWQGHTGKLTMKTIRYALANKDA